MGVFYHSFLHCNDRNYRVEHFEKATAGLAAIKNAVIRLSRQTDDEINQHIRKLEKTTGRTLRTKNKRAAEIRRLNRQRKKLGAGSFAANRNAAQQIADLAETRGFLPRKTIEPRKTPLLLSLIHISEPTRPY